MDKMTGTKAPTPLREAVRQEMSPKRYAHTLGVVEQALTLSAPYGLDPLRVETAALLHDICKEWSREDMRKMVLQYYPETLKENDLESVEIMHGFAGAALAAHYFHVEDPEILEAICCHTVGKAGLSLLGKIIYIADATEPGRRYPEAEEIRRRTALDLDEGIRSQLAHIVNRLTKAGKYIHPNTLEMQAWLAGNLRTETN